MYYTGVSSEYLDDNDLRLDRETFCKELLKKEGKVVSITDGRLPVPDFCQKFTRQRPDMTRTAPTCAIMRFFMQLVR